MTQPPAILAIDPGTTESAVLFYERGQIVWSKKDDNQRVRSLLRYGDYGLVTPTVVIESLVSYGMTVGEEVFTTAVWIGRFFESWLSQGRGEPKFLSRTAVKMNVCGASRASDKDIREALIARWGGPEKALGGPKCKPCRGLGVRGKKREKCAACGGVEWKGGPLCGLAGDQWSALAIAVTYADRLAAEPSA